LAVDIHQLVAAICPDVYCAPAARREVKRIFREALQQQDPLAYLEAAAKAQTLEANQISVERLELLNPFTLPGFASPIQRHTLVYDSFDDSLEAFYFWLLDELAAEGFRVTKLADTFAAAPGSGLFAELTRRQGRAQQEAMRLWREAQSLVSDILRTVRPADKNPEDATAHKERDWSEAEPHQLRTQVEKLKLYARWLGPYLKQARQLEQNANPDAGLVALFNTVAMELTLLAQQPYPVEEAVDRGELPKLFLKSRRRGYATTLLLELKLRAAPERTSPGAFGYRGRMELVLSSYALNEDELAVLRQELDRENLSEVCGALTGLGAKSLSQFLKEIEHLVREPEAAKLQSDDPNPFIALFDFRSTMGDRQTTPEADLASGQVRAIRRDSDMEQVIRSQAILEARRLCLEFYKRCKQRLGMTGL